MALGPRVTVALAAETIQYIQIRGGCQGKEGDMEVGPLGLNTPNPTLPLNLHVPLGEQKKRQATAPARALKDRDVKVEPKTEVK